MDNTYYYYELWRDGCLYGGNPYHEYYFETESEAKESAIDEAEDYLADWGIIGDSEEEFDIRIFEYVK